MHAIFHLPLLPVAALLLAGTSFAQAESPMTDPVAPAVIGRPLDQIGPMRPARPKPAPSKPVAAKRAPARSVVAARPPAATQVLGAPAAATLAAAPSAAPRAAKQAVDDRADPGMRLDNVGEGKRFARKPLAEGAYIGPRHRTAVRQYYERHPVMRPPVPWKIGEPVPLGAVAALPPQGLMAVLPKLPPGHAYVELGGEVVLVASGSKMVVDGVSRPRAETAQLAR